MFGKKPKETSNCCQVENKPAAAGCGCSSNTQDNIPAKEKQEQNRCC